MRKSLIGFLISLIFIGPSCITPVYERAKIEGGFHWAAGVSYSKGRTVTGEHLHEFVFSEVDYDLMRIQLLGYYGFSRSLSFFIQTGGGYGIGYDHRLGHTRGWEEIDLGLGIKVAPTDRFAVKLNTGFPSLLDISLLWDIDKHCTLTLIGRSPWGLLDPQSPYLLIPLFTGIGITFHIPLLEGRANAHIFLRGGFFTLDKTLYNLQLGFGVGN